jgi:hypothetical protein
MKKARTSLIASGRTERSLAVWNFPSDVIVPSEVIVIVSFSIVPSLSA